MSRNSKPSSIGRPLLFPYFLLVGALYYWLVPNLNPSYGAGVLTWFITLAGLYLASSPIEMGNRTARRASATVPPMALRDGTGLARAYAVVNMRSFNIVATGETLQAAIRLYHQILEHSC